MNECVVSVRLRIWKLRSIYEHTALPARNVYTTNSDSNSSAVYSKNGKQMVFHRTNGFVRFFIRNFALVVVDITKQQKRLRILSMCILTVQLALQT